MRYFIANYLAYITVCLPKVQGFESARKLFPRLLKENSSAAITSDNCKNLPPLKQTIYRGKIPMNSKIYLDEKVQQGHYQDLLREAAKERLLAQLPRHRRSQQACCR
jgi:hypothetical protein